jgi:hypothetical protein
MKSKLIIACGTVLLLSAAPSLATTGYLKGERASNFNKVCIYDVLGSAHTINVPSTQLCPLTIDVDSPARPPSQQDGGGYGQQKNGNLVGEQISGMNKVCVYDYLGDKYTYTISSISLCPLTRKF